MLLTLPNSSRLESKAVRQSQAIGPRAFAAFPSPTSEQLLLAMASLL